MKMKKSIFTFSFLGFIFAGCSSKPLTITSVDYISEVEKKIKTVYFDFDKSFVRDDQWGTVISNSNVLNKGRIQAHNFVIEGHCDEWGTDEYNYALGVKRAVAVKDALVSKGVSESKIVLVSYGESKPTCTEKTRECWAENRKVTFKMLP